MMALGVVLHSAQMYLTLPIVDYYWDASRSVSMDVILIFINTFRMPTFFLLSGFFTAMLLSKRGFSAMLDNRFRRIALPFLIFLPILAVVMSVLRLIATHIMVTGEWGIDIGLVENTRVLWDNTHNLWFLYYLMMILACASGLVYIFEKFPSKFRIAIEVLTEKISIHSLFFIFSVSLALGAIGSSDGAGRISASLSFVPSYFVLASFGVCFSIGWVIYSRRGQLPALASKAWLLIIAAIVSLTLALGAFAMQGSEDGQGYTILHLVLSLSTGLSITCFMLGFVGLFSRYFIDYSPAIRYFSDSSYWIFIFHSIPLVLIALPMAKWQIAAEVKFFIVVSSTSLVCLVTYHYWVRDSWIGKILNGRRMQKRFYSDSELENN